MTIEERLVKRYGSTDDPGLAVWLLKDGTLVNGSYGGHQRDVDHHEISDFYHQTGNGCARYGGDSYYIHKFMRRGNIRWHCTRTLLDISFAVTPAENQLKTMFPVLRYVYGRNIPVRITKLNRENGLRTFRLADFLSWLYARTKANIPDEMLRWSFMEMLIIYDED